MFFLLQVIHLKITLPNPPESRSCGRTIEKLSRQTSRIDWWDELRLLDQLYTNTLSHMSVVMPVSGFRVKSNEFRRPHATGTVASDWKFLVVTVTNVTSEQLCQICCSVPAWQATMSMEKMSMARRTRLFPHELTTNTLTTCTNTLWFHREPTTGARGSFSWCGNATIASQKQKGFVDSKKQLESSVLPRKKTQAPIKKT